MGGTKGNGQTSREAGDNRGLGKVIMNKKKEYLTLEEVANLLQVSVRSMVPLY